MISRLFITWDVNPVFFHIGDFEIRYYALSWIAAFIVAIYLFKKMLKREHLSEDLLDPAFYYTFFGTIIGARLGHCFFYDLSNTLENPLHILNFREGGLASHGATIGIFLGLYLFSRKYKRSYIWTLDRVTTIAPLSGAFVRIGNLINSEIYGTQTDLPWGFIFVKANEVVPMHPTQIYEALAYIVLFAILYSLYKKSVAERYPGMLFGICLVILFGSRIIIEVIKNPQELFEQSMTLNMGQILSIPLVICGIVLIVLSYKHKIK